MWKRTGAVRRGHRRSLLPRQAASEFASRQIDLPAEQTAMATDTVYVPDELDYHDTAAYRVLVMQQLGHREFGTYRFNMATASERTARACRLSATGASCSRKRFLDLLPPRRRTRDPETYLRRLRERRVVLACWSYPGLRPHLTRFPAHQHAETGVIVASEPLRTAGRLRTRGRWIRPRRGDRRHRTPGRLAGPPSAPCSSRTPTFTTAPA